MRNATNIYVAVVDDDESICRSFTRLLRAAGFFAITYPSAEAFLNDQNHPQFYCLLLDVQLEAMSGIELCRRLSAVNNPVPVIFITAHEDAKTREEALSAGCAGFFQKSDPGDVLVNAIRRVIGLQTAEPKLGSGSSAN